MDLLDKKTEECWTAEHDDALVTKHPCRTTKRRHPSLYERGKTLECLSPRTMTRVNDVTGEIYEELYLFRRPHDGALTTSRCSKCSNCRIGMGKRKADEIKRARPSHAITLTLAGCDYPEISKNIKAFTRKLRKLYPTLENAWAAESNPNDYGCQWQCHVHMYIRVDDPLGTKALANAVQACWPAKAHTQAIPKNARSPWFSYPMKSLAGDAQTQTRFLALNGTSARQFILHPSKGFFARSTSVNSKAPRIAQEPLEQSQSPDVAPVVAEAYTGLWRRATSGLRNLVGRLTGASTAHPASRHRPMVKDVADRCCPPSASDRSFLLDPD